MKKLFLALCFIALSGFHAGAKMTEVLDVSQIPQQQPATAAPKKERMTVTPDAFGQFLLDRLQTAVVQSPDKISTKSVFVEPSEQAKQAREEAEKGAFQKIYDQAMERALKEEADRKSFTRQDVAFPHSAQSQSRKTQLQEWSRPNFPVLSVTLPTGQKETVPAREHIPYLMNNIEILPNGMVTFNETVMVVANGQKLRNGLTKVLPRYIYSRNKEKQKIEYTLSEVTVNGQKIPYKLIEQGDFTLLVPEKGYQLEPGVYTYNFKYLNRNVLWDYGDFKEFYWDVTGSSWNLVIAKSGATLTLPPSVMPLGQDIYLGYPQYLRGDMVNLLHPEPTTWGYAAKTPLFIGEGFHIIMSLPENAIMSPSWDNRLLEAFTRNGDLLLSLLGLAAIWISFVLSWKYIKNNQGQMKAALRKNGIMLRYLAFNRFDLNSIGSFLLELYRKNIIDIQQTDDTVLLIKRTDALSTLSRLEKKAVGQLFTNNEPVFNANKNNFLKISRAADCLEKELNVRLRLYILKRNSGYLFFSIGMLLLTELFIAFLQINPSEVFAILALATAFMLGGVWLAGRNSSKRWFKLSLRGAGGLIVLLGYILSAAVISPWAGLALLTSSIIISRYTSVYAQRNGLLSSQIKDAQELAATLRKRRDDLLLGKEILNQQSAITALGLTEEFKSENPVEGNKLEAIQMMIAKLR